MSVLDVGTFDGFYAFLAEHRGVDRVVAVDDEQYRLWVASRWGVELVGGEGLRAIHRLLGSAVEYRRMDAFELGRPDERFDLVYSFGILHRVENPLGLLHVLRGVDDERRNRAGRDLRRRHGRSRRTRDPRLEPR
jgi:tRNA (mo5U34)-methyltransferase